LEWNKVKNIIILLLAAVNLFLLLNLFSLISDERTSMEEAAMGTASYLKSKSIIIDDEIIPRKNNKRQQMVIERSIDTEVSIASALVGGSNVTDAGGTLIVNGPNGNATWRSGALLDADITVPGLYNNGDESVLVAFLESAGINTAGYTVSYDELGFVLTLAKEFGGENVLNCSLVIRCEQNNRATVSGRWFTSEGIALSDSAELEPSGLIIKYVERMESMGVKMIAIEAIESGYIVQQMTNVGIILIPVLKITTDGVSSYVNAIDGNIVLSETY